MTTLDWTDLESAADEMAGNWQAFDSFTWFDRPDDCEKWCIVYTSNRDSRLLEESNTAIIDKALGRYRANIRAERHNHWACGYVDGYAIRVRDSRGRITPAFRKYAELMERLADYPILDETEYSEREYLATLENVKDAGGYLARREEWELPEEWESTVFDWLWNNGNALENVDDQGGYPDDAELRKAFQALGYSRGNA